MAKDIVKNILRKKLAWGCGVIAISQILGALPMLDFLSPKALQAVSFFLGVSLSIAKAVEMYFDQTAALEKDADANAHTDSQSG